MAVLPLSVRSYGQRPFDRAVGGGGFHVFMDANAHSWSRRISLVGFGVQQNTTVLRSSANGQSPRISKKPLRYEIVTWALRDLARFKARRRKAERSFHGTQDIEPHGRRQRAHTSEAGSRGLEPQGMIDLIDDQPSRDTTDHGDLT
jgi:hypothetical protein